MYFEGKVDNSAWFTLYGYNYSSQAFSYQTTGAGAFILAAGGLSQVRVRAETYASGTITVKLRASLASNGHPLLGGYIQGVNGALYDQCYGFDGSFDRRLKTDAAGELQVDIVGALPTGGNNIGDVDVLTVPAPLSTTGGGTEAAALRVTLATDSTGLVSVDDNGASLTVDAPVGTPLAARLSDGSSFLTTSSGRLAVDASGVTVPTTLATATTGGPTMYYLSSAATTNATNIKNAAGQLYGYIVHNNATAMRKLCFHNSSSAPTAGAGIYFTVPIPAGSLANVSFPNPVPFSSGIGITTVTGIGDTDATAVAANDLKITLLYA